MSRLKKITKMSDMKPDKNNTNKGTERGRAMLEDSLGEYGFGKPIVVDREGTAIAGNHVLEVAAAMGFDNPIIVRTDGKRPVILQRTDLTLGSKDGKADAYSVIDNRVGEVNLNLDNERLLARVRPEKAYTEREWTRLAATLILKELDATAGENGEVGTIGLGINPSQVRMIQLFLTVETEPDFMESLKRLGTIYDTSNVTDTVVECVRRVTEAYEDNEVTVSGYTETRHFRTPRG